MGTVRTKEYLLSKLSGPQAAQIEMGDLIETLFDVLAQLEALTATGAGDVMELSGAGVPVDYTDGDPPATGEGVAPIGARYTDTTNGQLYLNGGTQAEPIWKQITRAA